MEPLRQSIDIIWNQLCLTDWLRECRLEQDYVSDQFLRCLVDSYKELTIDQADAVRHLVLNEWMLPVLESKMYAQDYRLANVLIYFLKDVLTIDNTGDPICIYSSLLKWREVSHRVGDDMLVCAFLAYNDLLNNRNRDDFAWSPTIGHTNHMLNAVCGKGLTELHFHLKGSSLNFDIQWLSLMNDILDRESAFEKLERHCKSERTFGNILPPGKSLADLAVVAAYMRWWLFRMCCCKEDNPDVWLQNMPIRCMYDVLECPVIHKMDIMGDIVAARAGAYHYCKGSPPSDSACIDYAIPNNLPYRETKTLRYINSVLHGERFILYNAFRIIYGGTKNIKRDYISYALMIYTKIKCIFRKELLQINGRKGFENFAQYQDDKELFLKKGSVYEQLVTDLAIKVTCCNQSINYLEYRIAPKNNVQGLIRSLQQPMDLFNKLKHNSYLSNLAIQARLRDVQSYAIIHFIKKKEKQTLMNAWRNHTLRATVKAQALVIHSAYTYNKFVRNWLCGFDAANAERWARPEVFAQAFRFLRGELRYPAGTLIQETPHSFGMTYHVGEDFWDVVDGLRAIDEAILFLNLQVGDRLGHAMALGINIVEYYKCRHMYVSMPKQIFLDNLMWLNHKLRTYNISIPSELQQYMDDKIFYYACEIYGSHLTDSKDLQHWTNQELYAAWLLRGDNPDSLNTEDEALMGWNKYARNNFAQAELNQSALYARKDKRIIHLALLYHFCKAEGNKMCMEKLPISILSVLPQLQCCMRKEVERQKIAIETNLSSNLFIGEFFRYDTHPILQCNRDMLDDTCETSIPVSINTDDQGIFNSSISNEFALMASAVEKISDADGLPRFRPVSVLQWLEYIRVSAQSQRFVRGGT